MTAQRRRGRRQSPSDLVTGSNFVADGSPPATPVYHCGTNTGNNVLIQNATIVNLQLQWWGRCATQESPLPRSH